VANEILELVPFAIGQPLGGGLVHRNQQPLPHGRDVQRRSIPDPTAHLMKRIASRNLKPFGMVLEIADQTAIKILPDPKIGTDFRVWGKQV